MSKIKLSDVTVDVQTMYNFTSDTESVSVTILDVWAENLRPMVIQRSRSSHFEPVGVIKWVNQNDYEEDSRPSLYSVLKEVVNEIVNQSQTHYTLSV